tara:strand:+ start:1838 stop:2071 length:234 start_codon:yes stop_codon:yes gene_type:complete
LITAGNESRGHQALCVDLDTPGKPSTSSSEATATSSEAAATASEATATATATETELCPTGGAGQGDQQNGGQPKLAE